jgi:hypothetical protein
MRKKRKRRRRLHIADVLGPHMQLEAESDTKSLLTSDASAKPPTTAAEGSGRRRGAERWDMRGGVNERGGGGGWCVVVIVE